MKKIVLASASPRRKQLLSQIGINCEVVPSKIEEVMDATLAPYQVSMSLAEQKCRDIAKNLKGDSIVIAADTIVFKDGQLLGKPKDADNAFEMLQSLNGEWHEVITGICLYNVIDDKILCDYEVTKVKMAYSTEEALRAYIHSKEPLDKAGSYGIQGLGALLVERIEGCYFNVMGLPLNKLASMLMQLGYNVL